MRLFDALPLGLAVVAAGSWAISDTPEDESGRLAASAHVYYPRCAAARAAGAAPIYRGEPGYRSALDADNDGIACEPYSR